MIDNSGIFEFVEPTDQQIRNGLLDDIVIGI